MLSHLPLHLILQTKLAEVQTNRKDLEEKVDALRTVKEKAEQPENEAKERHLKAWEGIRLRYHLLFKK